MNRLLFFSLSCVFGSGVFAQTTATPFGSQPYRADCSKPDTLGNFTCTFVPVDAQSAAKVAAAPTTSNASTGTASPGSPASSATMSAAAASAADPKKAKTAAKAKADETAAEAVAFDKLKQFADIDVTVPESPALAVLGINGAEIQRPTTLRALTSSLIHAYDKDGKLKNGVAVDVAPMPAFFSHLIRGGTDYAGKPWIQAATRTTVSFATTSANDAGASKFAWGVRVGVFDRGDPGNYYQELVDCIKKAPSGPLGPGTNLDDLAPEQEQELNTTYEKCNPTKRFALWAQPALYVGYGQSWYSESGKVTDRIPAANRWWATYSQGMAPAESRAWYLFQAHASRLTDNRVADPTDNTRLLRQDSTEYILRTKFGTSQDTWHGFGQAGRRQVRTDGSLSESIRHVGLGVEFKVDMLAKDTWLQIGTVKETGFADGSSRNVSNIALRFGTEPIWAGVR